MRFFFAVLAWMMAPVADVDALERTDALARADVDRDAAPAVDRATSSGERSAVVVQVSPALAAGRRPTVPSAAAAILPSPTADAREGASIVLFSSQPRAPPAAFVSTPA